MISLCMGLPAVYFDFSAAGTAYDPWFSWWILEGARVMGGECSGSFKMLMFVGVGCSLRSLPDIDPSCHFTPLAPVVQTTLARYMLRYVRRTVIFLDWYMCFLFVLL